MDSFVLFSSGRVPSGTREPLEILASSEFRTLEFLSVGNSELNKTTISDLPPEVSKSGRLRPAARYEVLIADYLVLLSSQRVPARSRETLEILASSEFHGSNHYSAPELGTQQDNGVRFNRPRLSRVVDFI